MVQQKRSFEEAIAQLEEIVTKLEQGDVPLEDAISYFKEGMELSKICHEKLQNVEKQMTVILGENGELRPFSIGGEE
ncbi:exodeoxyribonuclease VII small subunit [Bacillus sp. 165]|uniref:exodeoxyribonuclease VII small subunit n=1 Tax=Bacillus sp. 165 TaxID=1529117 RepID=UPI001ADA443C|nr:exodeoxyribonuclease VII small subunit [Bacillus sp. 165]MBO9129715.1 exodeoxyribonuclease VII small subunit [Bacillus sp. 165]